ncbi:MAG: TAXI family TRAP transporter solute-binding subunit [Rhodospirillales bacterium]
MKWSRILVRAMMLATTCYAPAAIAQENKPVNLALGSVAASSGVYAFSVALANVVSKNDPGLNVTAVEGGGGFDHAKLMKQGVLDWSVSGSPAVVQAVRSGTGSFQKEGAWEPSRLMFMRNVNVSRLYVSAEMAAREGIRSWSDLTGKSFGPGVPGTRDMTRAIAANKLLETGIDMVPGSLDDTTAKLKDGSFAGMLKGSPHDRFDTAMLAVHYATPLVAVGFSDEEARKITADNPMNTLTTTPRGGIRELPDVGPLIEMSSAVMVMSSSNMSQETGYRIMQAVYKGWAEINEAYPPTRGLDPIADAIRQTPEVDGLLFHAGVVQMAREMGIEVPERLIPPEYKPVNR